MSGAEPLRLLGVDIGGTKIAVAVVDPASGAVIARRAVSTPAQEGPVAVVEAAADLAARVLVAYPATAAGVGAPGVVDARRGVVATSTGVLPGWEGTAVAAELERRLGLPFAADNDVNAAALGEARYGAGRGLDSFLLVVVGTGLGGAIVQGGRVLRGATGTTGEIGHVPVFGVDGVVCSCGSSGHLEAVVAAPAITAAYHRATGEPGVDIRVIARRATAGEAEAVATLAAVGTVFGRTLGGLVNTLDPEAVVLGGGVMQAGPPIWEPLEAALRAEVLPSVSGVPLRPAALGVDAGVIGAAALALELVEAPYAAAGREP
ncbi:MAG TPA: ROK family protein [Actinomycetota bacterium]|nr:ROK family protein [Actinomycetota bacterium]